MHLALPALALGSFLLVACGGGTENPEARAYSIDADGNIVPSDAALETSREYCLKVRDFSEEPDFDIEECTESSVILEGECPLEEDPAAGCGYHEIPGVFTIVGYWDDDPRTPAWEVTFEPDDPADIGCDPTMIYGFRRGDRDLHIRPADCAPEIEVGQTWKGIFGTSYSGTCSPWYEIVPELGIDGTLSESECAPSN